MSIPKIIDLKTRQAEQSQGETEAQTFATDWPRPPGEKAMPAFTWQQLERQLTDLAATPQSARLVSPLVSGIRKQARFKPPEMTLREILCLAWTLLDEEFCPQAGEEPMT